MPEAIAYSPIPIYIAALTLIGAAFGSMWNTWHKYKLVNKQEEYKDRKLAQELYINLAKNIRHMMSSSSTDYYDFEKEILAKDYYVLQLYASDAVIKKLNETTSYRQHQKRDQKLITLCQELLLTIRKDVYKNTKLQPMDMFFLFNDTTREKELN